MKSANPVTHQNFRKSRPLSLLCHQKNAQTTEIVYGQSKSSTTLHIHKRFIYQRYNFTRQVHGFISLIVKACNKKSFLWGEEQNVAFRSILELIAIIPNLYDYDNSNASKVKCDASHSGLGGCLEQEMEPNVWAPIAFALRFLNSAKSKYSPNESEFLAIVWACEHFRTYLLGKRNVILTDHKTVIYALNETHGKKP